MSHPWFTPACLQGPNKDARGLWDLLLPVRDFQMQDIFKVETRSRSVMARDSRLKGLLQAARRHSTGGSASLALDTVGFGSISSLTSKLSRSQYAIDDGPSSGKAKFCGCAQRVQNTV